MGDTDISGTLARRCVIDSCIIYLMCCGDITGPDGLESGRLYGRETDEPLSEKGHAVALRVATELHGRDLACVYTSPNIAAFETAQLVVGDTQAGLKFASDFSTADYGLWEGMTYEEIGRRYPSQLNDYLRDPGGCGFPDGETLEQVQQRAVKKLREICAAHLGERVGIITHKQPARCILSHVMALPLRRCRELSPWPCALSILKYTGRLEIVVTEADIRDPIFVEAEEEAVEE